ncbi:hypothetical protein [Sulfitobacter sp. MF3-043]|uniref:hypothetical protein n=1 Tax=Sulfitobacter sediminivivens TaxID=3252902 RepID=UPI0036DE4582
MAAFTTVGVGAFIFIGALIVSNAAFNSLGRPGRSTLVNWLKDGALSWPLASWLSLYLGTIGVIFGQALAGVLMGVVAALWGWAFVARLQAEDTPPLDRPSLRPYPNPDRYRRR